MLPKIVGSVFDEENELNMGASKDYYEDDD